jgi:hypothetical protein
MQALSGSLVIAVEIVNALSQLVYQMALSPLSDARGVLFDVLTPPSHRRSSASHAARAKRLR